jgi:hypothetical protein
VIIVRKWLVRQNARTRLAGSGSPGSWAGGSRYTGIMRKCKIDVPASRNMKIGGIYGLEK